MGEEDIWRVTDLLDEEHQPFVEDVKLARQMVSTYNEMQALNSRDVEGYGSGNDWSVDVRIPRAAIEFMENTLSEWYETVAEIEKRRGNMPYLIDRSLYSSGQIDWNQGITKTAIDSWLEESDYGIGNYPFLAPMSDSSEPLSGYFNRLLPVKFVLRLMVALTLSSDGFDKEDGWDEGEFHLDTVTLEELREVSFQNSSYAKETLLLMDKLLDAKGSGGSKISVGFPTDDEKSKERFVSQFVGSTRKKVHSGALFDMGFVNKRGGFLGGWMDELWFTTFGWHFAMMENPVIDQIEGWEEGNRFSDEEVEFLLAHFKNNVSGEWEFMLSIAEMIKNGIDDATSMNAKLIRENEWNRSKASVYRTGAIARMQELGLVDREKTGVEVKFVLTENGNNLLKR